MAPHGILAGGDEALDAQVLLDPFEEQLNLPEAFVERGDGQGRQCRVVGKKHQCLACLAIASECGAGTQFLCFCGAYC